MASANGLRQSSVSNKAHHLLPDEAHRSPLADETRLVNKPSPERDLRQVGAVRPRWQSLIIDTVSRRVVGNTFETLGDTDGEPRLRSAAAGHFTAYSGSRLRPLRYVAHNELS